MGQRNSLSTPNNGVELFRQAISKMPQHEYESWVSIYHNHAIHSSIDYFLPWHRAYLYFFEKRLQGLVPGVTIPYWDWTRLPAIPPDFQGDGNPLTHTRNPGSFVPILPSLKSIEGPKGLLNLPTYRSFASHAENSVSHRVHNWVGADMARIAISPRDPLFWCHHAHLDCLWDRWQRANSFDGPTDLKVRLKIGDTKSITVREVLRSLNLGYEYGPATTSTRADNSTQPATPVSPQIRQLSPDGSAIEMLFDGIPFPKRSPYEIRVFFGLNDPSPATPTDDNPNFLGYFDAVVMGHERATPGASTMTVFFELTESMFSTFMEASKRGDPNAFPSLFRLVPIGDAREFQCKRAGIEH